MQYLLKLLAIVDLQEMAASTPTGEGQNKETYRRDIDVAITLLNSESNNFNEIGHIFIEHYEA